MYVIWACHTCHVCKRKHIRKLVARILYTCKHAAACVHIGKRSCNRVFTHSRVCAFAAAAAAAATAASAGVKLSLLWLLCCGVQQASLLGSLI